MKSVKFECQMMTEVCGMFLCTLIVLFRRNLVGLRWILLLRRGLPTFSRFIKKKGKNRISIFRISFFYRDLSELVCLFRPYFFACWRTPITIDAMFIYLLDLSNSLNSIFFLVLSYYCRAISPIIHSLRSEWMTRLKNKIENIFPCLTQIFIFMSTQIFIFMSTQFFSKRNGFAYLPKWK